jgi:hypothetical protein
MDGMPMREDCRHYESRTYSSGEVVRMCRLDLAPDAPWRCPDDCPKYNRRTFDAGWTIAPLTPKPTPPEPPEVGEGAAAELLDAAEEIINAIGPEVLASVKKQREGRKNPIARGADRVRKKGKRKKK